MSWHIKVNFIRSSGNALSSKYKYTIPEQNVKLWSPLGKFSFWRASWGFMSKVTKCEFLKPQAHLASSLLPVVELGTKSQALKATCLAEPKQPNVKFRNPLGKVTPSNLWLKSSPSLKRSRPLGKRTASLLLLNLEPNHKLLRPIGKFTPVRVWLKLMPNLKVSRLLGKLTAPRLWDSGWIDDKMQESQDFWDAANTCRNWHLVTGGARPPFQMGDPWI